MGLLQASQRSVCSIHHSLVSLLLPRTRNWEKLQDAIPEADFSPFSILFFIYFILSVYSLIPSKDQRSVRHSKMADIESPQSNQSYGMRKWEFEGIPKTPNSTRGMKSPATPRTMAFNTLDGNGPKRQGNRDLPLRHHISMGAETYQSPTLR